MSLNPQPVYLVDGLRTPFLKAGKAPGQYSASDLSLLVSQALLEKHSLYPDTLSEIIVGAVMPEPDEANIARRIGLRLQAIFVPAFTVQRNCASGLAAIDVASERIRSGQSDLVLVSGTEAMSRAPFLFSPAGLQAFSQLKQARGLNLFKALRQFPFRALRPYSSLLKGLTDASIGLNMGQTAEHLAYEYGITRAEMDGFALESHQKALKAYEQGHFPQVHPILSPLGAWLERDTGIRADSRLETLAKLVPAFEPPYGKVTAGNSASIADGAASLLLASEKAVKQHRLPTLARLHQVAWAALKPIEMGLGPVYAMQAILEKTGLNWSDIDYLEINEAFAAQVLACLRCLSPDTGLQAALRAKLNPLGGSIALGHPVGASGARLVLDMAIQLQRQKASKGLISLCIGGGQGGALLVEKTD